MNPPSDCVSPIGAELFERGLKRVVNSEFYCSSTRPPAVYRGNPFVVEAAIAYGGDQQAEKSIRLLRFANRVPLIFQQSAGAISKAVISTTWRNYGLSQSSGALPVGPLTLAVDIASVWVPFTSESKEAVAHYPEIVKEIRLAVQECGRKLGLYVHKKKRVGEEIKKRSYIEKYIPHVAQALIDLLSLPKEKKPKIEISLKNLLEKQRGAVQEMKFEKGKNIDYDEEFAKIGKEKPENEK